jgi:hypothetical protein
MSNIYSIIDFPEKNKMYGNYIGNKPKEAAEKAFIFLVNQIGNNFKNDSDGKFIVYIIKNIVTNKEYKYIGTIIKLKNPKNNYLYKNVISRYNPKLNYLYKL